MKRRFANKVEGDYLQKRVEEDFFQGYICYVKIKNVSKPLIVNNGVTELCIKNNNYEWYELYPDNGHYALTIMYDNNKELIEWYFDISKEIGLEKGIPYEDDLYLDMVITPKGEEKVIDEDELLNALQEKIIIKEDYDLAYQTLKELEEKYLHNLEELIYLTNYAKELFLQQKIKI